MRPARLRTALSCLSIVLALAVYTPASATESAQPNTQLFQMFRDYGDSGAGWTGGDSTYSVLLPDGRIVWIFSDTFLGEVYPDHSRPRSAPLVNNSLVVQDGQTLTTHVGVDGRSAKVKPREPVGFYWMGDGTVEGDKLRVFALRFVALPATFVFAQVGLDIATFSLPSLELLSVTPAPSGFQPTFNGSFVSYGSAIMEHGGYTYVYGVEDLSREKFLHLARAREGRLMEPWEFWTGEKWSSDPKESARLLSGIANEFSVVPTGSGFRLVTQDRGIGRDILSFGSSTPEGPWTWTGTIYTTPETNGNVFTYNAHEHPELASPGRYVISYNVNSFDTNDIYHEVDNYRPRFIDIPTG